MDAARTAQRLGGNVTIVYRRTRSEMPARVEELHHALEEGIALRELCAPSEFLGDDRTGFVTAATLEVMELGEPDDSGRRRTVATGRTETMHADLVIMALGNAANPIIKDSEPRLNTSKWGTIVLDHAGSQETTLEGVYTGGDAARGGSTAIAAAGDGRAAANEILGEADAAARSRPRHGRPRPGVHRAGHHRAADPRPVAPVRRHRGVHRCLAPASRPRPRPGSSSACCPAPTASSSR